MRPPETNEVIADVDPATASWRRGGVASTPARSCQPSSMLLAVAVVLAISMVGMAGAMRRPAPAAALALLGGVATGAVEFFIARADGPRNVAHDVAIWAAAGLVAFGVAGLAFRPAASRRSLMRAGLAFAAAGVILAPILAAALLAACPLYTTDPHSYCWYSVDVLGGWVAGVVILEVGCAFATAALLWISSLRAPHPRPDVTPCEATVRG
jgi:hypothetical protein